MMSKSASSKTTARAEFLLKYDRNQRGESSGKTILFHLTRLLLAILILAGLTVELFTGHALAQAEPPVPGPVGVSNAQTAGSILYFPIIQNRSSSTRVSGKDWPMVGADTQRTSWSSEEVSGDLQVEWYRPIEAYISQNTQVIAANGLLYISTARGLYALNAADGEIAWRFDTELPLGNSPTYANGVVYVGGYDRKLHALDANTGVHLWSYDGAKAGYDTNPLVVEGKVIAGNRDGNMYAIGANGTANQGQLIWKFQAGGPIHLSAAYQEGLIFFAANDNYAYAVRADNGSQVWKSEKLPGEGYQSYWPVIYQDKLIFSAATGYRENLLVGTQAIKDPNGTPYESFDRKQRDDLFYDDPDRGAIGPFLNSTDDWAHGKEILNASKISEYLENNPDHHAHLHKPWRRTVIILNISDGSEYTLDVDGDGHFEYAPVAFWGTRSGNRYPPIVGLDGMIYFNNIYGVGSGEWDISQGQVMGWKIGTPYFSVIGGQGAVDEPQAISGGGNAIYRNLCCDRVGDYFWINQGGSGKLWEYNTTLSKRAPGYDEMWWGIDPNSGMPRLNGNYGTKNGVYHNHGDQNPIVPYGGKLYVHRSNAVIAFGPGQGPGKLPRLAIVPVKDPVQAPSLEELKGRLEAEIKKIVSAGHLRPGYVNPGQFSQISHLVTYFDNPGDTLAALARAIPYLSAEMQTPGRAYLKSQFKAYFDPVMYSSIGWAEGSAREAMPLPPEVASLLPGFEKSDWGSERWSWFYPPHNLYALWKYAQVIPEDTAQAYRLAKEKIQGLVPAGASNDHLSTWPLEHNAYIAGYIGFLNLQELAGKTGEDAQLRSAVSNELNRLLQLRASNFSKDTPWIQSEYLPATGADYPKRALNVSRNFIFLVPELGDYLNQNSLGKVQEAVNEYNYTAPYWFVSRYNAAVDEGARQNLYDYYAVFQSKAYILKEPREQLTKWLDVPAFERGDLFYIQNLIAAIEAGPH